MRFSSMRTQGPIAALLLSLCASLLPATAAAGPLDPKILPAMLYSAGRVDTSGSEGVGSGFFLDANYSRTFLNGGVSYKSWGSDAGDLANAYVGVGFSKLVQLQIGMGTQGVVTRVRNDFNLTSISDFITGTHRNRYNTSLGNRLTLTFALENYKDEERLDNFHIGLGLLY
ncbi:MAG: hypothetical protein ACRERR_09290 [Moraxellaceae bacterium]